MKINHKIMTVPTFLMFTSLLLVLWIQWDRLLDPYRVEEDFRSFYWMNKFTDPDLFPNDQLEGSRYYMDLDLFSLGVTLEKESPMYGLLFYAASFFMTPVLFSKVLPFFITPLTSLFLYKYGSCLRDSWTGAALAILFVLFSTVSLGSQSVLLGLQRSFGPSMIIFLMYYLHRRQYLAAGLTVLLSALIYAPAFVLAAMSWAFYKTRLSWRSRPKLIFDWRGWLPLLAATLVSILFLAPFAFAMMDESRVNDGQALNQAQQVQERRILDQLLWDNPKYQPGGFRPLFEHFPFVGRLGIVDKLSDGVHFLILFAFGCVILLLLGRKSLNLPPEIWAVLLAGFALYFVALLATIITNSFPLHMPSRYTRLGIFIFLLVFVGINLPDFARKAPSLIFKDPKRLAYLIAAFELLLVCMIAFLPDERTSVGGLDFKWLLVPIAFILGVLGVVYYRRPPASTMSFSGDRMWKLTRAAVMGAVIFTTLGWGYYARLIRDFEFLNPSENERELLRFLETLPKDALIAGYPCALDNVPLFSKRQIMFSCEQSTDDGQLIMDTLNAYYAGTVGEITQFCNSYHVDDFVVDKRTISQRYLAQGWIYYEPYNSQIYPKVIAKNDFALMEIPSGLRNFENKDYFVFPCSSLEPYAFRISN
jgi:hypothetical protein